MVLLDFKTLLNNIRLTFNTTCLRARERERYHITTASSMCRGLASTNVKVFTSDCKPSYIIH